MNQAVNIAVQIHKGAEAGNLGHLASHHIAHLEAVIDGFPRIGLKLLDTKGDALILLLDFQNDGFHFVALLENFGGMIDLAGPAHIGHVDHAVDAFFQSHKSAVGSKVANLALDDGTNRETGFDIRPGIVFQLADTEGNLLFLHRNGKNHGFDFLVQLQYIARTGDSLDPGQFGNVH